MTIVNEFSLAFSLDVNDVFPVLSDLQLHLSLWPIMESLVEVISKDEVLANLKIGDSIHKTRLKISTKKEDEVSIVVIEGYDDLSLELRLSIVGRKLLENPLTLIKGKVTVKSSNEKLLKPYIKEFVDKYQNRMIETLPALIDAWRRGLVKKVEEVVTPQPEVATHKETEHEEILKYEFEHAEVNLVENPVALEDESVLSNIILKSQILNITKEELSGLELLRRVSEAYVEAKLKNLYVLATEAENNKVRILIKDRVIVGVRIEAKEGVIINGAEAVKKLKELGRRTWRITTYATPEELT